MKSEGPYLTEYDLLALRDFQPQKGWTVYGLTDITTGELYYVGMTKLSPVDRLIRHLIEVRSGCACEKCGRIMDTWNRYEAPPHVIIFANGLQTEQQARTIETTLIGCLPKLTNVAQNPMKTANLAKLVTFLQQSEKS